MNIFATAALTALATTTLAIAAQTQEHPPPQSHPMSNAAPSSYQHQDSGLVEASGELRANSGAAPCPLERAATKDAATSTAFAGTAAQEGTLEVALAGLALRKSRRDPVRQLALKVAQDYARSNGELDSIVKCEGLILPIELDTKRKSLVTSLAAKSDRIFDRAYLQHIGEQHSDTQAMFESASRSRDPQMAAFARKVLAMLQEHQRLARDLRAAIARES